MSMTESEAKFWLDKLHGNILRDRFAKICTENEIIALIESKIAWMELEQYRAIGTVSEFRELKEKATAKKPNPNRKPRQGYYVEWYCPTCEKYIASGNYYPPLRIASNHSCCVNCGQKLDWSEGKE